MARALPEHFDREVSESVVVGDEGERFQLGLRCQHPIEWIAMPEHVAAGSQAMLMRDSQAPEIRRCNELTEEDRHGPQSARRRLGPACRGRAMLLTSRFWAGCRRLQKGQIMQIQHTRITSKSASTIDSAAARGAGIAPLP